MTYRFLLALKSSLARRPGAFGIALLWLAAASPGADFPAASPLERSGESILASDWPGELLKQAEHVAKAKGGVERTEVGVKLITREQPEFIYSQQLRLLSTRAVKNGDTLLIRFAGRSLQADKAVGSTKLRVAFGSASGRNSSLAREIAFNADWLRCDIPFTCAEDFAPGKAALLLSFGFPPQIVEIADLQVLDFGSAVPLAALPKTRRSVAKTDPAVLQRELQRVADLRRQLDAVADPSPANGRVLHVAAQAPAGGDGSEAKPFATIPQALRGVRPGDTILVGAGEYREPRGISIHTSGRPDAWIKIKAAPGTRPKIISSGWVGFGAQGGLSYLEIEGFELTWTPPPDGAVQGVGVTLAYATHHVRVLRNVIHGFGTSGIGTLDCDYIHIEGNHIYNNAKTSPYGGSAISLCRAFNFDENPGYHNVVRGNICHDNENTVVTAEASGGNGRTRTDGNGIIIDVFKRSRAQPRIPHNRDKGGALVPYRHRTLVENNLVYDNGGRGVHVFRSAQVDVINNTCYLNQRTPEINAGELTAIESTEVLFANNIAYGPAEKRANGEDGSTQILWTHNQLFGSEDILHHPDAVVADPLFVAAGPRAEAGGFRLRPDSPARGKGLALVAPRRDLAGAARPPGGPIDLGAFQLSP